MSLILHNLAPLHWALAGLGIAGVTLALLLLGGRRLGISTGFEDICSLVLPAPYFRRTAVPFGRGWRLPLFAGLVLGGVLSAVLGGGWEPTWALGVFDRAIGFGPAGKLVWMFAGGCSSGLAPGSPVGARAATACSASPTWSFPASSRLSASWPPASRRRRSST